MDASTHAPLALVFFGCADANGIKLSREARTEFVVTLRSTGCWSIGCPHTQSKYDCGFECHARNSMIVPT